MLSETKLDFGHPVRDCVFSGSASRAGCPRSDRISDTLSEICAFGQHVSDMLSEIEHNLGHPVRDLCFLGQRVSDMLYEIERISGSKSEICRLWLSMSDTVDRQCVRDVRP